MTVTENGIHAKEASYKTALLSKEQINEALLLIADDIVKNTDIILEKNAEDVKLAAENGMNEIMLDRLSLSEKRIDGIATGVRQVASLHSKVGEETEVTIRPNGLKVFKRIVPLGVIAMIFESRPNVTVDAATLALKTGNAIILRGGKEAHKTNAELTEIMQKSRILQWLAIAGIPLVWICSECGWITAEVGRQPWIIEGLMPTRAAVSAISSGSVQFTFWLFAFIFTSLLIAEISIMLRYIHKKSLIDIVNQ